jgi:putative Mg2+ transporter-C (MgtC) family protein
LDSLTVADVAIRVLAALAAGTAIGLEREWKDKPAGIRTYALVCQGATLFMIVGILLTEELTPDGVRSDPSRIASTVVQGIGFLAGGVIFTQRANVQGLTTAAAIWVTAAIGLLIGGGYFLEAAMGVAAAIFILVPMRWFEHRFVRPAAALAPASQPEPDDVSDEATPR